MLRSARSCCFRMPSLLPTPRSPLPLALPRRRQLLLPLLLLLQLLLPLLGPALLAQQPPLLALLLVPRCQQWRLLCEQAVCRAQGLQPQDVRVPRVGVAVDAQQCCGASPCTRMPGCSWALWARQEGVGWSGRRIEAGIVPMSCLPACENTHTHTMPPGPDRQWMVPCPHGPPRPRRLEQPSLTHGGRHRCRQAALWQGDVVQPRR